MITFDESFLEEVGLEEIPEIQRRAVLVSIYRELESRVGERLSEGMTDRQLADFTGFLERDLDCIGAWLYENDPNWANSPDLQKLTEILSGARPEDVLGDYAATRWLRVNRPDYKEVVEGTLAELRDELRANREAIVEAARCAEMNASPAESSDGAKADHAQD